MIDNFKFFSVVAAVGRDDEFFIGLNLVLAANKHALKLGKIYPLQISQSLNAALLGWQIGQETTLQAISNKYILSNAT